MIIKDCIILFLLLPMVFLNLILVVYGDCGCGARCQKYTSDLQCTRCCTATVRRSVPVTPPDEMIDVDTNAKIYDIEMSKPVETPQFFIIPRSSRLSTTDAKNTQPRSSIGEKSSYRDSIPSENTEILSNIIDSLNQEERHVRSTRRRRTLQKARERLLYYQRLKSQNSLNVSLSPGEIEMFELLESILSRIRIPNKSRI